MAGEIVKHVDEADGDGYDRTPVGFFRGDAALYCRADDEEHVPLDDVLPEGYTVEDPDGDEWTLRDGWRASGCPWCLGAGKLDEDVVRAELGLDDIEELSQADRFEQPTLGAVDKAVREWARDEGRMPDCFERVVPLTPEDEREQLRERIDELERLFEHHRDDIEWAREQRHAEDERERRRITREDFR